MAENGHGGAYQDPGWGPAFRAIVGRRSGLDGLTALRALFLTLTLASFGILLVLMFMDKDVGSPSPWKVIGVAVLSVIGATVANRITRRKLDPAAPDKAASEYRSRFFLAYSLNDIPLLVGFVLVFVEEALWPYFVAMPIFVVGMFGIAPGKRNLEALDRNLMAQGATFSLRAQLAESSWASDR